MRRFVFSGFLAGLAGLGACSLINAPADVLPGGGGAGGATTTTSTAESTSSSTSSSTSASSSATTASSSGSGGMGGGPCTNGTECATSGDACNIGACVNGACVKQPDPVKEGAACDDGVFCTTGDVCKAGVCGGAPRTCPDVSGTGGGGGAGGGTGGSGGSGMPHDACHVDYCDEAGKACSVKVGNDGQGCDDGEPCTSGETCFNGMCGNGIPTDCSAGTSECSVGMCMPGVGCQITVANEAGPCSTNDPCAVRKCAAGKCTVAMAKNVGQPCDDGLFCTTGEACTAAGVCGGGGAKCVKPTDCIDASCDEAGKMCNLTAIPDGQPCDVANACTGGSSCNGGACGGGTPAVVYFSDSFSGGNNKGWALGPEWQIGAAKASSGGAYGADPAADHTGDSFVAGVVIGGNETPTIHPAYYMESPAVDVSAEGGKIYLTYYRWLNSDYLPFMRNLVEVFDGTQWNVVWQTGSYPGIQDSPPVGTGWTFISHDITQYKNAGLKVRFGYAIESGGVYTIGSWNLDDVKIQNAACPAVP